MNEKEQKAQEKLERQQRQLILDLTNKLFSQFSFKKVNTWHDVYRLTGFSEDYITSTYFPFERNAPVSKEQLIDYCGDLRISLEVSIWLKHNPPNLYDKETIRPPTVSESDRITAPISVETNSAPVLNKNEGNDESGFNNENNYGLVESPKEKAFLFWFQKRATKEIIDGFCVIK